MLAKHEVMGENKDIKFYKNQIEEIKQEIIQCIEKYIDEKLQTVMNYLKKKKDFYEMSFL
ncbi:hypothetical protein LCGC14_0753750 [marine sediment metagenome]|uniref:Uncharacterized protein n=1 Tax=marine sediment metagenome TaxID=412755 RepID=A0A0F9TA78_9ZZZZ